jgi:Predicted membrane protein (DUF2079)
VIGLLLLVHGPYRRLGIGVLAAACAWGLAAELVVMPALRGSVLSQVDDYYRWLQTASPAAVLAALLNPAGWLAFAGMVASMAAMPLLRPRWLLPAGPPLLADLLSAHHPQPELLFQYGLPLVVPIVVAGGLGARRLLDRLPARASPKAVAALAAPALLVGLLAAPLPPTQSPPSGARQRLLACTVRLPPEAPAAVDDAAAYPLAARPQLQITTEAAPADFVVVDRAGRLPSYVAEPRRQAVLAGLPAADRHLLCDDGRFQLWSPAGG